MITQVELSTRSDFDVQVRDAEDQLRRGRTVQLRFKFLGREMAHTEIGFDVIHRALFRLATVGRTDAEPKLVGRNIRATLAPFR